MFYSNQLLSRKGPFGQIWIAATMQPRINRRKVEQIDIAEICEQILNPVVPLALRLSGILMGGVVLIYNRKVKFFSEDVNNLLVQIKLITATKNLDTTSLPKDKSKARFETITIEYGFDEHNYIEKALLQAHIPEDTETARDEEFFFIPEAEAPKNNTNSIDKFQVEQEKITIQEDPLQPEAMAGNDNDDRIPPPDDIIMDDLCPDFQIQDELPPHLNIAVEEDVQQSTVQGLKPSKGAEAAQSSEGSPQHKKTRTRRKTKKRVVMDLDFTEIPSHVFNTWLKEPGDIVKDVQERGKRRKLAYDSTIEKQFCFPSSSLSWSAVSGVESTWAPEILELWNLCRSTRKSTRSTNNDSPELPRQLRRRTMEVAEEEMETHAVQNNEPPQEELSLIEAAEILQDIQEGANVPNFAEYGSIEKLRSALHTPNTKNQDELLINQLGLTPRLSGQSGKSKTALRMSTPSSGRLSLDKDIDFPRHTTRTAQSGSIHAALSPGLEILPDDYLRETIAANYDAYKDGDVLGSNLSQFVLEETWPSQDPLRPRLQPIDKITSSILQLLRDRFNQHPKRYISSDELIGRVDRSQAAKIFYQICGTVSTGLAAHYHFHRACIFLSLSDFWLCSYGFKLVHLRGTKQTIRSYFDAQGTLPLNLSSHFKSTNVTTAIDSSFTTFYSK